MIFRFNLNPAFVNLLFENEAPEGGGGTGGEAVASTAITTTDGSSAPSEAAPSGTTALSSPDTSGQTVLPSAPSVDEIIASLPESDDDLAAAQNKDELLVSQRKQLRVLAPLVQDSKSLLPYKPLLERGAVEMLTSRLDLHDKLFTPQTDPQTQQTLLDPRSNAPLYTTSPWLEAMRSKQAGFIEQHTHDLMYLPLRDEQGNVRMIPGRNEPETVLRDVFRQLGLNPDRYQDYKSIDTLLAQSGNAITDAELKAIPEELQEAYKRYPASMRQSLWGMDEEARNFVLQGHKRELDRQAKELSDAEAEKSNQARVDEQNRQIVAGEQDKFLEEHRVSGRTAIMNSLREQVSFGDNATNDIEFGVIEMALNSLLDPDFESSTQRTMKALGIELNGFYQALGVVTTNLLNQKAYELSGRGADAENAASMAYGPEQQVVTKAGKIALEMAMRRGAQKLAKSIKQDERLAQAGASRVIPDGNVNTRPQSPLPAGMRADSAEANSHIWQNIKHQNAAT